MNEQLKRAVRIWRIYDPMMAWQQCRAEGISEHTAARACKIVQTVRDIQPGLYATYGDPSYGAWPASAAADERARLIRAGLTEEEAALV